MYKVAAAQSHTMQQFLSPNAKVLSVLITPSGATSTASTTFPTQQDLENRKIIAIQAYMDQDITNDPLNPSTVVMTSAVFSNAFLTLYTAAVRNDSAFTAHQQPGLFYDKIPFPQLRNVFNNNTSGAVTSSYSPTLFLIRPTELSFNKCKVEFPTPVAMASPMSAVFVFHYLDKGDDGSAWMHAMGYPSLKHR